MIVLIAALDRNGVIGRENRLPWHLPDDQQRFKALTMGRTVVMGRKTYESIGRPLPHRRNVVVTHQPEYRVAGALVVHGLDEALAVAAGDEEVFIAGGGTLYAQALPLAGRLYLTEVETAIAGGDAFFPAVDPACWRLAERTAHPVDDRHAFAFSYATYERVEPARPASPAA